MDQTAIPCSVMRGGTSKGLYFLARDLPADRPLRDAVLLAAMGAPDPREIDGMGGGHPLTSKVAIVSGSGRPEADIEYLFVQVWPDRDVVSEAQNCGNLLAGVAQFAIGQGLIPARDDETGETSVRIWMRNTSSLAVARIQTPGGEVAYHGPARITGVPGTHAPVSIEFAGIAGSTCGALLPTGDPVDLIDGVPVTCVDNGMPVVCLAAEAVGLTGTESPDQIEANPAVRERVEAIRLEAGRLMGLSDAQLGTVPKLSLLSPATAGGAVSTRTFIPHRVHEAIGVLGAVSVATACVLPGSAATGIATPPVTAPDKQAEVEVEHPTGSFTVSMRVDASPGRFGVTRVELLRTARLLMRGEIFIPASVWSPS